MVAGGTFEDSGGTGEAPAFAQSGLTKKRRLMSTEIVAAIITGISTIIAGVIPIIAPRLRKVRHWHLAVVVVIIAVFASALSYSAIYTSIAGKYEVYDNGKHVFDSVIYMTGFRRAESFGCGDGYIGIVRNVDTYRRVGLSSKWIRDSDHTTFEVQENGDIIWSWPNQRTTAWKKFREKN